MDGELDLLACGTGECGVGFGAEVALAVSMEEGDVSDRSIAVGESGIGDVFRHSLKFR